MLRRWKFAARSEQLHGEQRSLLEETIDADLEAMQTELDDLQSAPRLAPAIQTAAQARGATGEPAARRVRHEPDAHGLRLRL